MNLQFQFCIYLIARYQNVASLEGNKLVIKSNKSDGSNGERIYEFSDNGLQLVSFQVEDNKK